MPLPLAELLAIEHQGGLHPFKLSGCVDCCPAALHRASAVAPSMSVPEAPAPPRRPAPHRFLPAIDFVDGQRVCAAYGCGETRANHPKIPIAPGMLAGLLADVRKTLPVTQPTIDASDQEPESLVQDTGPYCEMCRGARRFGRGLELGQPGFGQLVECPACARGWLMQKKLEKLFGSLPELYRDLTLESFPTTHPAQAKAVARVREWMDDPVRPWLYLHGEVGRGKTGLAVGAVHEAVLRGRSGLFQDVTDLLSHIKRTYRSREGYEASEGQILDALYDVDLLVLDDIGAQNPTDWAVEMLFLIIGSRHRELRQTIITSNLSLPALAEHFGHPRTASRIQEMTRAYILDLSRLPSLRLRAMSA